MALGGLAKPQLGHAAASGDAHSMQKFAPGTFCVPQFEQIKLAEAYFRLGTSKGPRPRGPGPPFSRLGRLCQRAQMTNVTIAWSLPRSCRNVCSRPLAEDATRRPQLLALAAAEPGADATDVPTVLVESR